MSNSSDSLPGPPGSGETRHAVFATTHWSVVLGAASTDTTRAREALSRLCRVYWYPLYAYVRRRGCKPEDAEDLTQEFFARLLHDNLLAQLTVEGGRFRSFLLKSLNHLLTDQWRRAHAQKRGGGQVFSLDAASAESRYGLEPADLSTPETLYDRAWARALLASVYQRLEAEYERAGRVALFNELKFCLTGQRSAAPYAELAERLALPVNTVKTQVRRMRERYRQLLRDEVAQTVRPDEVEAELRELLAALASTG